MESELEIRQTIQCKDCGHVNEADRSFCEVCQRPLTAYAQQLTGEGVLEGPNLVHTLEEVRPLPVTAMAVFALLLTLFWPLAGIMGAFAARKQVQSDQLNYLAAAVSAIGPVFATLCLLPIALILLGVAWGVWDRRPWAWTAAMGVLGGTILVALLKLFSAPLLGLLWGGVAIALLIQWHKPAVKSWFGH